jgi:hypothetical protein
MRQVLVIAVIAMILLAGLSIWSRGLGGKSTAVSENPSEENSTSLEAGASALDRVLRPRAPDIVSDTWLNSPSLASADLRGKVVLIEFWTFG